MFHLLCSIYTCITYKSIDRANLINSQYILINCRDRKIPKRKNVSKLNIVKDRKISCM